MRDGRADPLMGCLRDGSAIDRLTDYISWFTGRQCLRPDDGLDFLVLRDGRAFDRPAQRTGWIGQNRIYTSRALTLNQEF